MKNPKVRQVVLPLLAAVIWGCSFVTQSLSASRMGTFSFGMMRMILASLFLLVLVGISRRLHPREKYTREQKKTLLRGGIACGIMLAAAINLQQYGMKETSAGKAGFITALYIVLVPVFGLFIGKKPSRRVWFFVALAVGGLYFLCFTGEEGLAFSDGDFYIFLCAIAFALHIMVIDHFGSRVDSIELSCAQFITVAVISGICALLFGERITAEEITTCLPYILYAGILTGGVGYTCQIVAQKDGDPTVVSLLLSLESFFAVVSGAIFLHERMSLREYFGCALMLTAVVLSQLPEKSAKAVESGKKE